MPKVIAGIDIEKYATNPIHEKLVEKQYNFLLRFFPNEDLLQEKISHLAPYSPITAKMIFDTAEKYRVDPWLIAAIIQIDTMYGTKGIGAKTHNPGNVGNDDEGNIKDWGDWQSGLDAVAEWLRKHRV